MKKFLMAVAFLACLGGAAFAGPNFGGTINVHDANLAYTVDITNYCGLGSQPTVCEDIDAQLDGSTSATPGVWKVYAVFDTPPRLKGMTFGINYTSEVILVAWGPCIGDPNNGGAEFPGGGWPGSGTGTSLVFQNTLFTQLVECYWFGGYNYYGNPGEFCLQVHPDPILGGNFADDSVPSVQDEIAGFGCMGFETPGVVVCPGAVDPVGACCIGELCTITTELDCAGNWLGQDTTCEPDNPCIIPPPTGACCIGTQCIVLTEDECIRAEGDYQGNDIPCDDEICQPINPTEETSWGQIKANYR